MIRADLLLVANHLWQSTLCVGAVWVLTFALNNNRAAVRFWLWLAASVKFLIPFSLFVTVGRHLAWRAIPASRMRQWPIAMEDVPIPLQSRVHFRIP